METARRIVDPAVEALPSLAANLTIVRSWPLAALVVVALGSIARLAHLDADPYYYQWIGYVVDEGRWTEQARNVHLFHSFNLNHISILHLLLAPGFQLASFISFSIFDLHLWSARLVSAVFGIGILITTYWILRKRIDAGRVFFAVLVLAFQVDLVFLSRVAIPEMASLCGHLVAFAILMSGRPGVTRAVAAGIACAIALVMKGTTLFLVPAYLIAILSLWNEPAALKVKAGAAFAAALGVPLVLALALGLATGLIDTTQLLGSAKTLRALVSIKSPYSMVSLYFNNSYMVSVNLLLVGAWLVSWLPATGSVDRKDPATRIFHHAGIWTVWWLAVCTTLSYMPVRYVLHVLVPLVLYVAAGAHLGRADRLSHAFEYVAGVPRGLMRTIYATWLALPLAILTAPILAASIALLVDVPVESLVGRLRHQISLIALVTSFVVLFDVVRPLSKVTMQIIAYGSLLAALIWALGSIDGALWTGFWDIASSPALWKRSGALLIPFLAVGMLRRRHQKSTAVTMQALIITLVAALFLDGLVPQYSRPSFSIRDESRALARVFPAGAAIYSRRSGSLFLENDLRYEERFDVSNPPAGVVVFEHYTKDCCPPIAVIARSYRLIYRHELRFDPRYFVATPRDRPREPATIAVYEPKEPERDR